jgi:hypothetical protein
VAAVAAVPEAGERRRVETVGGKDNNGAPRDTCAVVVSGKNTDELSSSSLSFSSSSSSSSSASSLSATEDRLVTDLAGTPGDAVAGTTPWGVASARCGGGGCLPFDRSWITAFVIVVALGALALEDMSQTCWVRQNRDLRLEVRSKVTSGLDACRNNDSG